MKTMMKLFLLGLITIITTSCSKDGEIGPTGLQGPQGEQGLQGVAGENGSSDIIYSNWTSIDTWNNDSPRFKWTRFPDLILTQEQIDGAAFLVYKKYTPTSTNTLIDLLPIDFHNSTTGAIELSYRSPIQGNGIIINVISYDRDIVDDEYRGPVTEFRYILIPGGKLAGKGYYPNFFKMGYEDVMDYFGLDY